ncbi:hypothetical protein LSTR_LSTR004674 [Laodelphax striatellus]|uniref:Uncharacterized protein n=1 Tax=Laodelphax striatellus TaxID=195883 RepID=A0A482WUK9_LAOST|nr:hypothetical protein LSTR_LSTR004674 [Laodelphax striatellus]
MDICRSCDRDWIAYSENDTPDHDFFSVWTPSCPNAVEGSDQYPCPAVILELGPVCPSTRSLIAATMLDPHQVREECRHFVAKFVFQRALDSVLYIQAAVEVVVCILEKERDSVILVRLNSIFDLLYIDCRKNLSATKYTNIIYFLKQIYTVLEIRRARVEFLHIRLTSMFLKSLIRWCRLCLESPMLDSLSEMETYLHVLKSTSSDMRNKLPQDAERLRSSLVYTAGSNKLKKGVKPILLDILKFFPVNLEE